jgi:hypothetical protein
VQYGAPAYDIKAVGCKTIVTTVFEETTAHPPPAAIVFVTVYIPALLADRSI